MNDVTQLADTIKPKSDQLNADDLLTGPITVTITNVSRGSKDQPVSVSINGYMPFKPCKTMRRVLIKLWGDNGKDWVGRSMTLFCNPDVTWAGVAVGGVRISHLSHIQGRQSLMVTMNRSRRSECIIEPLVVRDHSEIIKQYKAAPKEETQALWDSFDDDQKLAVESALTIKE